MDERQKLAKAREQVEAMTGFYAHLAVFVVAMIVMGAVNAFAGGPWWSLFVLLGWGSGVLGHGLLVFGRAPTFIRDWQLRKIREIKDKM